MISFLLVALIAVLSVVAQLILPWWSIALIGFIVCFWRNSTGGQAFWSGFISVALVWQGYASFIHLQNDGMLTGRMSQLLFKANMPFLLLELTVLIGGLIGGLAALSGHLCRQAFLAKPV